MEPFRGGGGVSKIFGMPVLRFCVIFLDLLKAMHKTVFYIKPRSFSPAVPAFYYSFIITKWLPVFYEIQ